ncbi:Uncharacterised protein [uncultured archaeon]|nr:Uncharacterised protein [uncultured archaeon]
MELRDGNDPWNFYHKMKKGQFTGGKLRKFDAH